MIFSNPAYDQLKRESGPRNQGHLNAFKDDLQGSQEPDWLFFTELNAHEIPGKPIVLEE